MPLTPGNFASLLEPGLRKIWSDQLRPSPMRELLFGEESSVKAMEHYQGIGSLGLVPKFTGSVQYKDFAGGYKKTIMNFEFAEGIMVERTLVDDEQYGEINRRARSLGDSFDITVEHDAASIFANAFTDTGLNRMGDSIAGADGVGLCSLVHPLSPSNTGSTQANEGTLSLSLANVNTTRTAMLRLTDDKSQLVGVNPDMILVPPELERTAIQIVSERALYEPGGAQFDLNMFAGRIKPVVWNRLTDTNAWFLIDSRLMKEHLIFQWRIKPEFAAEQNFDGIVAKYRGYMRYGIGWSDWKFIYGNNPS